MRGWMLLVFLMFSNVLWAGDEARFKSAFSQDQDRVWAGPDYWVNRLQDWRIKNGWLECVAEPKLKMRTAHLLTWSIKGDFKTSVRLRFEGQGAAAGFLIGAGKGLMDYRAAAIIHAFPGNGAGLFAGVTSTGRLFFSDFEKEVLKAPENPEEKQAEFLLELEGEMKDENLYELTLRAGEQKLCYDLPAHGIRGNLALTVQDNFLTAFKDWTLSGQVKHHKERSLGPILSTQHTLSRDCLKMTAQLFPIGEKDPQEAVLEIRVQEQWKEAARAKIIIPGYTATFKVTGWDSAQDQAYRVVYELNGKKRCWGGTVRKDPKGKPTIVVAGFTGNHNNSHSIPGGWGTPKKGKLADWVQGMWFPHTQITENVKKQKPDLLFFSGDQVYEGKSPSFADRKQIKMDYLYKWYLWCWAYRELCRDIPCVCIPDDHDVYQGNIWGEGGRKTDRDNKGGYVHPADFVRMVERTQTSHLPDPFDPKKIEQGIGVYFTDLCYGRIGFAVLEDRKFKSGCAGRIEGKTRGRPDHINDPDFDIQKADVPGLFLLGPRQLRFLKTFAGDWKGQEMKMALSQTIFANMATHHGAGLFRLKADLDSNGWPQSGRKRALSELRRGFVFHLAGDQHLASLVHHGIDAHNDAIWSFCVPSVANFYPRAWFPETEGSHLGEHLDGFNNKVTVYAVTNPTKLTGISCGVEPLDLHDKMPGFGIVRLKKDTRQIVVECWPRYDGPQYPGWPRTIDQTDNYGKKIVGYLPEIQCGDVKDPVVQVIDDKSNEVLYTLRIQGSKFKPWVFDSGVYRVRVFDPDLSDRDIQTYKAEI